MARDRDSTEAGKPGKLGGKPAGRKGTDDTTEAMGLADFDGRTRTANDVNRGR